MSDKRKCNLEFMNKKQSIQSSLYNILIENKIDEHVKNNFLIRIEKQEFEIERINKKLERLLDENEIYKKVLGDKNSFNDKFCCDEQKENVNNSNNYNLDDKYCCDEQKEIMNNLDKNSFNDNYCCDKQNENIINLNNVKEDFKLIKFDQNLLLLNNKYKKEIDELELENANLRLKIIKNEKERKLIVKEEKKEEPKIQEIILKNEDPSELEEYKKMNKNLEIENAKIISERLIDKKKYIQELEYNKQNIINLTQKYEIEIKILNDKIMDVNKSLLENENKIYENESKIKIFNIYDEIEKISGKSDENKNLYQEIIKLTKLYEDCLIELDLIKKKSLEDNNKNVFVDNSLELKLQYEKILEIKKIEFNVEHEKLKLCFEERKNAAQYHKRNFNKIFFENELLRKKFKTAFDDIKKLDKNVEIDKNQKDLQIDLENYRKLLRCTACDKNYKNTILLRCMHVFCKECVDERIKTRNRNCPNCNEHFISAEVKKIYL